MKLHQRQLTARATRGGAPEPQRGAETGDTLIEVLLAIVVLGLATVAVLLAFATSISSSAEYRNLATADTVLRTAAEETITQMQQNASTAFACPATFQASPSVPSGYSVTTVAVQYWNGTSFASSNPCVASSPELVTVTITATSTNISYTISIVVDDPLAPPPATATTATKLVFLSQPSGNEVAGSSLPLVVEVEGSNGGIVTSDLSPVTLTVAGSSGTLSTSCSGIEYEGVVTFSNCNLTLAGTYTITASDVSPSGAQNLTSATTGSFAIVGAAATQVAITPSPSSATASATTNVSLALQLQDQYGNATTSSGTTTLGLSTPTTTDFFATSNGASGSATINATFANGVGTATLYYGDQVAETDTITAKNGTTSWGTTTVTITPGAATQVAITPSPSSAADSATTNVALVLQLQDQFGNATTSSGTTTLGLSTSSPQGFFATTNGASGSSTINATFTNGVGTATIYYGDKTVATPTITAKNGTTSWGTTAVTITVGAAAKVAITPSPSSAAASATTNVSLALQLQDQFGNVTTSSGTTTLGLSTSSSQGFFATSNGASGSATINATFTNGVGTATLYYGDKTAATPTITAKNGTTAWGTTTVTLTPGVATQVAITPSPSSAAASATTNVSLALQLQDQFGNATTSSGTTTLGLSTSSSQGFFATSNGASGSATINATFNNGVGTATIYYGDKTAATPTITAKNGTTSWGTTTVAIVAGSPSQFAFTLGSVSGMASSSATLGPITVQEQDAYGNPTTVAETVTLTSNSTGTARFATTSGGAAVSTVSIPGGSSSVSFYYGDTKAGTATITASGSLASTFQFEFITAGPATKVVITPSPSSTVYSNTTNVALALQLEDQFGNTTTSSGTTTLGLSTNGSGFFATTNGASGSATMNVNFANGVGTATAYFGDGYFLGQVSTITAKNGTTSWGTTTVTTSF